MVKNYRHVLGVHETCVHKTFGTIRSIFITPQLKIAIEFSIIQTNWANLPNLPNISAKLKKKIMDAKWSPISVLPQLIAA